MITHNSYANSEFFRLRQMIHLDLIHNILSIFDKNDCMNSKVKYWIDLSDYDIETAKAM